MAQASQLNSDKGKDAKLLESEGSGEAGKKASFFIGDENKDPIKVSFFLHTYFP